MNNQPVKIIIPKEKLKTVKCNIINENEIERDLFLAVPIEAWDTFFQRPFIQKSIQKYGVNCLIFDPVNNSIVKWIK